MTFLIRLITQTVFSAIGQMMANKARAALTTLGIIIGVWAITAVIAAVTSLNTFVLKGFEEFGANRIELWGTIPPSQRRSRDDWQRVRLKVEDAEDLVDGVTTVEWPRP